MSFFRSSQSTSLWLRESIYPADSDLSGGARHLSLGFCRRFDFSGGGSAPPLCWLLRSPIPRNGGGQEPGRRVAQGCCFGDHDIEAECVAGVIGETCCLGDHEIQRQSIAGAIAETCGLGDRDVESDRVAGVIAETCCLSDHDVVSDRVARRVGQGCRFGDDEIRSGLPCRMGCRSAVRANRSTTPLLKPN